ncbi:SpoIIE family protein phosphatase [Streptomyces sp. NPDC003077]|uniref:SpoIIE family protein phosphatase n=1 Tax=Streptomyces sp. NPDC003077 TaxID=3154443 RepID=UPI0033B2B827
MSSSQGAHEKQGAHENPTPSGLPLEVFDPAPVGVAVFRGKELVLTYMNDIYRNVFGDRPLGSPLRTAFADLAEQEYLDMLDGVYATGQPVQVAAAPVTVRYAHGSVEERYFSFSLSGLSVTDGDRGVLVVVVEVTEQVSAVERSRLLAEERRRALRRYQSLVTAGAQKVWVSDPQGHIVERNEAWERVTGKPWEELRGDGWLETAHPEDRPGLTAAWFRAVEEVPDLFEYVYRLRHADGSYRHCDLRAVPVREDGAVVEWMAACTDIEERWRLDRRQKLLGRAAQAATESPSAPEAFAALSGVIVPSLADECGIYLLNESEHPQQDDWGPLLVTRVAARARPGLPPGLPPRREESVDPRHAIGKAVRERQPVHRTFPPGDVPEDFAPPGTRPWLVRTGAHSGVMLPVLVDGAVAAVVSAFVCGTRDPIPRGDRDLMRELIEQAHAPLSHALTLQRTQRVARALQHSLLTAPPDVPGVDIVARYLPSPAAADVGGDWYDSFVLGDGATTLIIGDVAGHDLGAAVTMSKLRNMLRALTVDREEPPGDILRRLDVCMQALSPEEGTATCVLARVEGSRGGPWQLNYSVAGHPPPLVATVENGACFLEAAQDLLLGGLQMDEPRNSAVHPLPPASTVLLYTDGLVERPDEDLDQGLERLRRRAAALAREPLDRFCDALLSPPVGTGYDDIAMIALRLPG